MQAVFHDSRIVRGGTFEVVLRSANAAQKRLKQFDAHYRQGISRNLAHGGLGFRCARSVRPRFQ
jgi:hypothetical protein